MAFTMKHAGVIVVALGIASFIFGVISEIEKPASGVVISGKDFIICKYPKDPTVALGYLSALLLLASFAAGCFFQFYPYNGKSIPKNKLFESTGFFVFFAIALFASDLGLVLILCPTIIEQLHIVRNIHKSLETTCPTAKTGLLGGGAFVSLCASLMWLVALIFAHNARDDYLEEIERDNNDDLQHHCRQSLSSSSSNN